MEPRISTAALHVAAQPLHDPAGIFDGRRRETGIREGAGGWSRMNTRTAVAHDRRRSIASVTNGSLVRIVVPVRAATGGSVGADGAALDFARSLDPQLPAYLP